MSSEAYYQTEIAPVFEAVEQLLSQANIPYVFLVMLDDETLEYKHSFPPAGVKRLNITIQRDAPAKIVPIPDAEMFGNVVESTASADGSFDGKAIDFGLDNQLGEGN